MSSSRPSLLMPLPLLPHISPPPSPSASSRLPLSSSLSSSMCPSRAALKDMRCLTLQALSELWSDAGSSLQSDADDWDRATTEDLDRETADSDWLRARSPLAVAAGWTCTRTSYTVVRRSRVDTSTAMSRRRNRRGKTRAINPSRVSRRSFMSCKQGTKLLSALFMALGDGMDDGGVAA